MKKLFSFCAVLLCAYQITNAQTQKGTKNIGLSLDFEHSSTNTVATTSSGDATQAHTRTTFDIGPNIGYFICDGLELGGGASYSTTKDNTAVGGIGGTGANGQNTHGIGVSAFFRKYVLYDNKIGFRAGPYAGYNYTQTNFTYATNPGSGSLNGSDSHGFNAGANVDLVYYPTNKVGIAATLLSANYGHSKTNDSNEHSSGNNFAFQFVNSGLFLSVFYVIGK